MTGDIEPYQSFLMAAKYDFMAQNIKTGSLVYLSASYFTRNDQFESDICPSSLCITSD